MAKCEYCGKEQKYLVKGLCNKHYTQLRLMGQVKRTKFDKNEIIIKNDYAELVLYNDQGIEKNRTLIDIDDIEKISQYKWCIDSWGYIVCPSKKLRLHRFITNTHLPLVVDHINRNTLDNRKSNLRICSQQDNMFNKDFSNCGIRKRGKKWYARIKHYGEEIHLGSFATKKEAINARKLAEIKYFK